LYLMLSVYTWGHHLTYVYALQWRSRIRGIGALQICYPLSIRVPWEPVFPEGELPTSSKRRKKRRHL